MSEVTHEELPVSNDLPAPVLESGAPKADLVERERLDKAVDDLMKFKKENAELKALQKEKEEGELKQNQEWKTYAERKEAEANEWKNKYGSMQETVVHSAKYNAVKDALVRSGMRPEAFIDLDNDSLSDVSVETTSSGNINVLGVDSYVEKQRSLRPHWFANSQPNLDTSHVGVGMPQTITLDDLMKAEDEAKKTGDATKYSQMVARYQKQKAGF